MTDKEWTRGMVAADVAADGGAADLAYADEIDLPACRGATVGCQDEFCTKPLAHVVSGVTRVTAIAPISSAAPAPEVGGVLRCIEVTFTLTDVVGDLRADYHFRGEHVKGVGVHPDHFADALAGRNGWTYEAPVLRVLPVPGADRHEQPCPCMSCATGLRKDGVSPVVRERLVMPKSCTGCVGTPTRYGDLCAACKREVAVGDPLSYCTRPEVMLYIREWREDVKRLDPARATRAQAARAEPVATPEVGKRLEKPIVIRGGFSYKPPACLRCFQPAHEGRGCWERPAAVVDTLSAGQRSDLSVAIAFRDTRGGWGRDVLASVAGHYHPPSGMPGTKPRACPTCGLPQCAHARRT